MSERDDEPVSPPELPVTTPLDAPAAPRFGKPRIGVWQIVSGVLAVTTVASLAWGVSTTTNLQSQLDTSQEASPQKQVEVDVTSVITTAQVKAMRAQLRVLSESLAVVSDQAGKALKAAGKERKTLEKQLTRSGEAIADLAKERKNADADAESVFAAYQGVQEELTATQKAMADLLAAVAEETKDAK